MIFKSKKLLVVILSLVLSSFLISCGISSSKHDEEDTKIVRQKVLTYLEESKGYKESDFDLEVNYNKNVNAFGSHYVIKVQFKDETDVIYYYDYNEKSNGGEISQGSISPINDKEDKNFKHAE